MGSSPTACPGLSFCLVSLGCPVLPCWKGYELGMEADYMPRAGGRQKGKHSSGHGPAELEEGSVCGLWFCCLQGTFKKVGWGET